MSVKCFLFDLDGTLLDTNNLVLVSLKYTIRQHLGKEVDERELYKYFGQPLIKIMEDFDPAQAEDMVKTYREYNIDKHDILTEVFPQVPETLREIKKRGIPAAIVTSKLRSLANRGLGLFGLEDCFEVCVGFEDTSKHKPEPEPVLKALELLGIDSSRDIIMVGDSPYDIMCANQAGITSAVVDWSLHPREVLETYEPDIWIKEFSKLLSYV